VHGPSFESLDSDDLLSPLATGVSAGADEHVCSGITDQQFTCTVMKSSCMARKSCLLRYT
jgi:hypothetical protein